MLQWCYLVCLEQVQLAIITLRSVQQAQNPDYMHACVSSRLGVFISLDAVEDITSGVWKSKKLQNQCTLTGIFWLQCEMYMGSFPQTQKIKVANLATPPNVYSRKSYQLQGASPP